MNKPIITKLTRFEHKIPKVCPFCLVNASLGFTDWGIIGCRFCQAGVDRFIAGQFEVRKEKK